MPNPELKDAIKPLEQKIAMFSEVLQKFGLNLIQSMGEMKHNLSVLTEKIDKIERELIDLKGLKAQLVEISRQRNDFQEGIGKIRAQMSSMGAKMDEIMPESSPSQNSTANFQTPREILDWVSTELDHSQTRAELLSLLAAAKERLYLLTGGQKIIFELRSFERQLESSRPLDEIGPIRDQILQHMVKWKNSLE